MLADSKREGSTPRLGESRFLSCPTAQVELYGVSVTGPRLQCAAGNVRSPGKRGRQPSLADTSSTDSGSSAGSTGCSMRH